MTLWELAQSWPHEPGRMFMAKGIPTRPSCGNGCRRCQLEQLLREKAKEYRISLDLADTDREAQISGAMLADLGVPEER